MEEIWLTTLGCIKPCKKSDKLPTSTGAGFLPSTVWSESILFHHWKPKIWIIHHKVMPGMTPLLFWCVCVTHSKREKKWSNRWRSTTKFNHIFLQAKEPNGHGGAEGPISHLWEHKVGHLPEKKETPPQHAVIFFSKAPRSLLLWMKYKSCGICYWIDVATS